MTYADLYKEANQISRTIQGLQEFEVGRPVLLHFDDHCDVILWFWSVLFAGGLPVLSSPFSNIEEERYKHIRALSTILESPICFTRSRHVPLFGDGSNLHIYSVENLLDETGQPFRHAKDSTINGNVTGFGNGGDGQARNFENGGNGQAHNFENGDYTADGSTRCKTNGTHDKDLAMLMLTSGSTGNAKAVCLSHAQVLASVSGKAAVRKLPQGRPFLNWIGLDHVAGLLEIHLQALWLGADQIHVNAADIVPSPETFLDLLSRHQVSRTFAPNFFLAKLVASAGTLGKTSAWDLSNLVTITSGGEANDLKTCLAASALLSKFGAPRDVIMTGFGMTETCAGAIYNSDCPNYDVSRGYTIASLGRCIDGIEMRITTPEGGLAAPDEPGDVEVCGPAVFRGYYRNESATSQAFTPDHWFRTGDRGAIDSNGQLRLVGRAKEVININGVKFVAADIQTAIEDVLGDRVARVVVFPSAASDTEQVTIAYIPNMFPLPHEEMVDIARLVTQACLLRTATRPLVFALGENSVPLLPLSTLGKISRLKMARLFEDGVFAVDVELHQRAMLSASNAAEERRKSQWKPPSEAEVRLVQDVAETLGLTAEELDITCLEKSLFDIGFTSMHVIKLKYHIQRRLGVEVSVLDIISKPTVGALAADLDSRLQHGKASDESYDPVVVFRASGSKTPLWLIHPGVGEVLVFVGLAKCLAADDRPVYALRAAGFERNHERFESIQQCVDVYTAAMRRCQPHGPYALAGYSYGSMLAFEVAKRLGAGGDQVCFLGCFNLPPHIKQRMRVLNWNLCLLHLSHFLSLVVEEVCDTLELDATFGNASRNEAMQWVLDIAHKPRWDELNLETDALERWADVAFGLQCMARNYDPSGQVSSMDIFHCIPLKAVAPSQEVWLRNHLSHWADFVREAPRFHPVQGEHYTMIGPEHVVSFAQTLTEALKARGV
ncbi:hypothetical protein CDD82_4306 [Ophiocordyceps australis]|uniref:Carrier domain-containing protein n=1 Tax=Ophiocordyceps australis TaxID=1399860 RepID=A0A2C5Z7H2_9HYPO|nr:hypothetical protein CDD82_4306 [Ophiocordyceps australis]